MMKRAKTMMKTTHLWSQEDEEQLIRKLVNNFCDLINRSEEEGLYWTGLKCDLIELAHIVWETGQLTDHQGRLMDFQSIVWHICRGAPRACPVQSLVCGIIRSGPQERASGAPP